MADEFDRLLAGLPRRRVLVVSDRYPPDEGGGAERSLHLLLREPRLRDQAMVVTFEKGASAPLRRKVEGVDALVLPAFAAWPLHRLTQAEVNRLKRRPFGLKWLAFARQAAAELAEAPPERAEAFAARYLARPPGGVAMTHRTTPGGGHEQALVRIIAQVRPELIHADNARAIEVAAGVAPAGLPIVAVIRDHRFSTPRFDQHLEPADAPQSWAETLAARFADEALAFRRDRLGRAALTLVASAHLERLARELLPAAKVRRLPLTPIAPGSETPEPASGFDVLTVGTLTPKKGQRRLLDLWPQVLEAVPEARLHIVGEGSCRRSIEDGIGQLRLQASVQMHGRAEGEALERFFAGCHVVALPTAWPEPFGRVALEAGAHGRPVVAYAVGGHAETIVHGETGLLAPPDDGEAFVAALTALARDPALRVRLGAAGRERAAAFAPEPLARGLEELWDDVVAGGGARLAG